MLNSVAHRICLSTTAVWQIFLATASVLTNGQRVHDKPGARGMTDNDMLCNRPLHFLIAAFDACIAVQIYGKKSLQQRVKLASRYTSKLQASRQVRGCVQHVGSSKVYPPRNGRMPVQVAMPTLLVRICQACRHPSHGDENLL